MRLPSSTVFFLQGIATARFQKAATTIAASNIATRTTIGLKKLRDDQIGGQGSMGTRPTTPSSVPNCRPGTANSSKVHPTAAAAVALETKSHNTGLEPLSDASASEGIKSKVKRLNEANAAGKRANQEPEGAKADKWKNGDQASTTTTTKKKKKKGGWWRSPANDSLQHDEDYRGSKPGSKPAGKASGCARSSISVLGNCFCAGLGPESTKEVLDFMESIRVMILILVVVLVSVALAVWDEAKSANSSKGDDYASPTYVRE